MGVKSEKATVYFANEKQSVFPQMFVILVVVIVLVPKKKGMQILKKLKVIGGNV